MGIEMGMGETYSKQHRTAQLVVLLEFLFNACDVVGQGLQLVLLQEIAGSHALCRGRPVRDVDLVAREAGARASRGIALVET